MKAYNCILVGFFAVGLLLPPSSLFAGLPQPMCVYYGQALDGYGLPYRTNADVILYHGANEVARHTITGSLTPGINFALYVHLDASPTGAPYSSRALHSGDLVSILVRDQQGDKTIMESRALPPVGQPGELVLINATAASDLDADGLPDAWEWELIDWSGGALGSLNDVRGEDDFDEDGMSNLQEYRAGTFAFLDYDLLLIEQSEHTLNNRLRLTFLSVPGKIYSARYAGDLLQSTWQSCPVALSDTGPLQNTPLEGNGHWLSLYVPVGGITSFFRLEAR